jgi:hypothetical protein
MRKRTWPCCKRSLRTGNKAITWRRAAGRHDRGLPPPTISWPGHVQRSWSKSKLQPNKLKLRSTESDPGSVRLQPSGYALQPRATPPAIAFRAGENRRLCGATKAAAYPPTSRCNWAGWDVSSTFWTAGALSCLARRRQDFRPLSLPPNWREMETTVKGSFSVR